jgi:tetratricopeptide (TPR) repeat protein
MIAAFVAAWMALVPAPSPADAPLGQARARLAANDLPGAEQAARDAVARAPTHGPALLVLGMVLFRNDRYDEALDLFQRAAVGVPPAASGPLGFNRASALFALARYREAEDAFSDAARAEPKLAGLAEVNAGLAALGAGELDRARAHAEAAARAPTADALTTELDSLRAQIAGAASPAPAVEAPPPPDPAEVAYARGRALYGQRRYDEAAGAFDEAVRHRSGDAELRFARALNGYRRDRRAEAGDDFEAALALGLDEESARDARDYLDRLSGGLRAQGPGLDLRAAVGGGYDSNVAQLAASRTEVIAAETPERTADLFLDANLDLAYGLRLSDTLFLQPGYTFDQLGYQREEFDTYAFQVHGLALRAELTPRRGLRLGLTGALDYQFTGLRTFEAFQRLATVEPQLAIDEGAHLTTLARLRWQDKSPYQDADAYYRGRRLDLRIAQRLRLATLRLDLTYRHRREKIGTRTQDLGVLRLNRRGLSIEGTYLAPYSHVSHAVGLSGSLALPAGFTLAIDGGLERLRYSQDSVWYATGPLGRSRELGRKRRHDDRVTASAELTFAATDRLELGLRYDLVVNQSNIHFAFDDKSSTKQVIGLELSGEF